MSSVNKIKNKKIKKNKYNIKWNTIKTVVFLAWGSGMQKFGFINFVIFMKTNQQNIRGKNVSLHRFIVNTYIDY